MEHPCNAKGLAEIIGDSRQPAGEVSGCSICRGIPEQSSWVEIPSLGEKHGTRPDGLDGLHEIIRVSPTLAVLRCPVCRRLYTHDYEYEYLVGGSEEQTILSRVSFEAALRLLEERGVKRLCPLYGGVWRAE